MNIESILQQVDHNPHYLNRYVKLIIYWRETNSFSDSDRKEKHHICPKSMFKEFSSGKINRWNIVALTARQHYIAHYLLWKAYHNRPMAFALRNMLVNNPYTDRNSYCPSRVLCQIKKASSNEGRKLTPEHIAILKRPKTEEHRAKISTAHKGKTVSEESKIRMSEAQRKRSPESRAAAGMKHRGKTISAEMRRKQSEKLSGSNNPRALPWKITYEDGTTEVVTALKPWCIDRGLKYLTIYTRAKNADKVFRDGFRIEPM